MKLKQFSLILSLVFVLIACSKDQKEQPNNLFGIYQFEHISDSNQVFAYTILDGSVTAITEGQIDYSLFANCSAASHFDRIEILPEGRLIYTIQLMGQEGITSRIYEQDYFQSENNISFTYTDELGNSKIIDLQVEQDRLVLKSYAIVELVNRKYQEMETYVLRQKQHIQASDAIDILGSESPEGDAIYVMVYEQYFNKRSH